MAIEGLGGSRLVISRVHFSILVGGTGKVSLLHRNAKVSALIRHNEWDSRIVIYEDLRCVELDTEFKDEVMWMGRQDGEYSNKSAYHALRRRGEVLSWSNLVWYKGRIPRHSFVTWLALHKALKTQDKLKVWKVIDRSVCLLCNDMPENEEHLFFKCWYSSFVWSYVLHYLSYNHSSLDWEEEWDWCKQKFTGTSASTTVRKLALNATIYHLWTERNCRQFQRKHRVAVMLIPKIIEDIRLRASVLDLHVVDTAENRAFFDKCTISVNFQLPRETLHQWLKPIQGWYKVNSDGSLTESRGGYDAVIRDHTGHVLAAAAGSQVAQSVVLHELQGVETGVKLAQQLGIGLQRVELCMDSSNALKYLTTNKVPPLEAIHITRKLKRAIGGFEDCKLTHTLRETNQAADILSKLLPTHEFVELVPSSFAEDLKKIILDDASGRKYLRM